MALYENTSDNVSKYCEPVKIKDYLEYGLPVITTKTTYMHKEIEKFHAGEVIDENVGSLKKAIDKIAKNYSLYEDGINQILNKYEYKKWYTKSFSFLE